MVVTTVMTVVFSILLVALDYLNIEFGFFTEQFIDRFTIIDIPESDRAASELEVNLLTLALVLFGIALVGAVQGFRVIRRKNYKTKRLSEHFTSFSDSYARYIFASLQKMEELQDEEDSEEDNEARTNLYNQISQANGQFVSGIANRIASMAKDYSGHDCHASIKVFAPHSGGIRTFVRDSATTDPRSEVDEVYKDQVRGYKTNSIFEQIIDDPDCHYFISNNLKRDQRYGRYRNDSNAHWDEFYNSCLVVPIATSLKPEKSTNILGFICIDSKKARFKNDYFLSIVVILSRLLSVYFESVMSTVELRRQRAGAVDSNK